jgi:hypothetical protein
LTLEHQLFSDEPIYSLVFGRVLDEYLQQLQTVRQNVIIFWRLYVRGLKGACFRTPWRALNLLCSLLVRQSANESYPIDPILQNA